MILKVLIDFESFIEVFEEEEPQPKTGLSRTLLEMHFSIYQQFARRIIFHQPSLFMKSLERVSFKDLILSDDFSMEDLARFLKLFLDPLGFPLKWFRDAVLDALAISRHGTAANVGTVGKCEQVILIRITTESSQIAGFRCLEAGFSIDRTQSVYPIRLGGYVSIPFLVSLCFRHF